MFQHHPWNLMPAAQMSVVDHCFAVWGSFQVVRKGQLAVWLDGHYARFAAGPGISGALEEESVGHPD